MHNMSVAQLQCMAVKEKCLNKAALLAMNQKYNQI